MEPAIDTTPALTRYDHAFETMVRYDDPRADGCDRYHPAQFQTPFSETPESRS